MTSPTFAQRLLQWYTAYGRHTLPWQHPRSAYRVWIAEVMLQQTQVATVIGYFDRFITAFPTLADLADASEDAVLAKWSGLGYYRRARHLHQAARQCMQKHHGQLPANFDELLALPGIGQSTAGAILAQAHGQRFAILDGNVKRVLTRHEGIFGYPGERKTEKQLWEKAWNYTPDKQVADYTQAIMDLGATVCTRHHPHCDQCPLQDDCIAFQQDLIRQLPERKQRKKLPTKHTAMLVMVDRTGHVFLQKRHTHGVWPGLWSLPESTPETAHEMARQWASVPARQLLDPVTHTFSHYRLIITPVLFTAVTPVFRVEDTPNETWFHQSQLDQLGIPAPVYKLLTGILL